jgi:hypothetical protein
MYQLPIFSRFPEIIKPFTYEKFLKIPKIPCASLQVRILKAVKDEDGNTLSLSVKGFQEGSELGLIVLPSTYDQGVYNTTFMDVDATELMIFEAKLQRNNPMLRDLLLTMYAQDKEISPDMTDKALSDWSVGHLLADPVMDITKFAKMTYLDWRFFSEYVAQLGVNAGVRIVHNSPNKNLFFSVISIVPPGNLYQTK